MSTNQPRGGKKRKQTYDKITFTYTHTRAYRDRLKCETKKRNKKFVYSIEYRYVMS